jgi:hypothetical protein
MAALEEQSGLTQQILAAGGLEALLAAYLSPQHRDHPEKGCVFSALLPELGRQPAETRRRYAERLMAILKQLAASLPPGTEHPEEVVLGLYATLVGTLQLARAVAGTPLSDRILAAGTDAARAQLRTQGHEDPLPSRRKPAARKQTS